MTKAYETEYMRGRRDRVNKRPLSANPYNATYQMVQRAWWSAGWQDLDMEMIGDDDDKTTDDRTD